MKCAACRSEMISKTGELDLRIHGRLYLVKNVTFFECPRCGEKVLEPEVVESLFARIQEGDYTEETMTVPVLNGAHD